MAKAPARAALIRKAGAGASSLPAAAKKRDLETTGTYDAATQEWVIHTPSISAGKEWIGLKKR